MSLDITHTALPERKRILVVEDLEALRRLYAITLSAHFEVDDASNAILALEKIVNDRPLAVVLDIRMPGMDGLALQKHLAELGSELPVIIMTGHGDVASAREAFRASAIDFLEKPLDHGKLLAGIAEAFARYQQVSVAEMSQSQLEKLLASLTPREREVMEYTVAGRHNREIAVALGISPRTVEVHKARMMDKLGVGSVAELVRLSLS